MSPGKRKRVTFADEPSIVTFDRVPERVPDQPVLAQDTEHDGERLAELQLVLPYQPDNIFAYDGDLS